MLLRFESVLLLGLFAYVAISAFTKGVEAPGALAGILFATLFGAGSLYLCSRAFASSSSSGRAPALLANLIAVGVSYFMISGHLVLVGTLLAMLAGLTALSSLFGYTE